MRAIKVRWGLTLLALILASALPPSALAQASWIYVGTSTSKDRFYVQKHNWSGRYRAYGTIVIQADGEQIKSAWIADCGAWKYLLNVKGASWVDVLEGTAADSQLKYVCN